MATHETKQAFKDAIDSIKVFNRLREVVKKVSVYNANFYLNRRHAWHTLESLDENAESFKKRFEKAYSTIEDLQTKNLGEVSSKLIKQGQIFDEAHDNFCYKIAGERPWGENPALGKSSD